jgi:hypothetical protein
MNIKIYTANDTNIVMMKCLKEVADNPGYRLGQALWNSLPNDVANFDRETNPDHYKFYNTLDDDFAKVYFYSNFMQ